ncbi:MBL fold metallo-hydrolase [Haloferax sp. MBLA0076]|uniref:MBL fold metallo-hydrolase n=1 Tax=Haloferax litoreum TaxID=2666140 RepID=A0A6A8GK64_9EURY|nr:MULTISPECIES: MBL fold metallo-hydrolase [Haloferax]KAB1190422.1 MBL fold metallo-hydrolase [Haloferax sp. CBA1148]MRX23396.1 MBL fold metallo-hydrolase [Haloferax litoreum]
MVAPYYTEVVPGVYEITWQDRDEGPPFIRGDRRRSYLFDLPDDVPTLVDTCVPTRARHLIDGIESTGVDPQRLIITHRHLDHAGAFDTVVDRFDVETWVPEQEPLVDADRLNVTTPADNLYGHEDRIGRFVAVHVGGHSPGSSALVDEKAGIAACGDVVSGSDRRGLPAGYLVHPPQSTNMYVSPADVVDAEENLVRLLDYDFEIALVHHGSNVFENASQKLERYVSFEPNYASDEPSLHRPSREGLPEGVLDDAF